MSARDEQPRQIWRFYRPHVKRHSRFLWFGLAGALGMVVTRLALPLPLARLAEPWLESFGTAAPAAEPTTAPMVEAGLLFLVLYLALGWFDQFSRLFFARFAVDVVRDVRRAIPELGARGKSRGDLLARLVGDAARLKDGVKGFLIHVATNALLLAGVSIALVAIDPGMAMALAAGFALSVVITVRASRRVLSRATKLRKREAILAELIRRTATRRNVSGKKLVRNQKTPVANLTRVQGRTVWAVHAALTPAILLATWLAARRVSQGSISNESVFLVSAYLLTAYHPMIRLCRQGTRSGKILACARRIEKALSAQEGPAQGLPPLGEALRLRDVEVHAPPERGGGVRLGPVSLDVRAGEVLAVIGPSGSGKTTLLEALTTLRGPSAGRIEWDGEDLGRYAPALRSGRLLPAAPPPAGQLPLMGSVLLLDDPTRHQGPLGARRELSSVLRARRGATVIVTLSRRVELPEISREVYLDRGRIVDRPPSGREFED